MRKKLFVLLCGLVLGGLAQDVWAQMSSPSYRIPRQAFSNSGGAMSSPTYRQPVTIAAQSTATGVGTSPGYTNHAGYLSSACSRAKGDMNGIGGYTSADAVAMLNCVYLGTGLCDLCFADVNCNGTLTSADAVLELNKVYLGLSDPPWCGP